MALSGRNLDWAVIAACCFAFVLFGYDQGVLSGLVSTPEFLSTFDHPEPSLLGTIVAIYDIGCVVGSLGTMWIGDYLGRRYSIVAGGILIIVGAALQASAFNVPHMIVGRIVTGLGNGINTTTVPIFQAEMSKSSKRGAALMGEVAFVIFGIALSNWVDFAFVFGIFPLATFCILPFVPESPRWLASKGRDGQVHDVVRRLSRPGRSETEIEEEASAIISAAKGANEDETSWLDLFRQGKLQNLRRMLLGAALQFIQQFTGINAVVYYGPAIFASSLGLEPRMAAIVGGCGSICFWIGSCTPVFFIEKVGRRKIMLWGIATSCLAMTGLAVASYYAQFSARQVASAYGALACILLYQFCYGASWAGIPWVYAPEVNTLIMRNRASAIASATEWMSAFIVVQIAPVGVANLGWRFYLIWMAFCAAAMPFIYFLYPETSGATLEEMDQYFAVQRKWVVIKAKNIKNFNQQMRDDKYEVAEPGVLGLDESSANHEKGADIVHLETS